MTDPGTMDFRHMLMTLLRRRTLLLSFMLAGIVLAFMVMTFITPQYSARALILIQSPRSDEAGSYAGSAAPSRIDLGQVMSEAEIIKSRELVRKLIAKLNLMKDPELNPKASRTKKADKDQANFKSLSLNTASLESLPTELFDQDTAAVMDRIIKNLTVKLVPGTYVMQVIYNSENPTKAALIANTVSELYLEQKLEAKFTTSQRITSWLDQRLVKLRQQLRASEAAVERYRAEHNLVQGARSEITTQQLSGINSELVVAQSERARSEAKLLQAQQWMKDPDAVEMSSEILNNNFVVDLKKKESDILSRRAELSMRYGQKHPSMIKINAELDNVREKIRAEMRSIITSLENDLSIADGRMKTLQGNLDSVQGERKNENADMIGLRELEREAAANRLLFDNFLETYKRNTDQESLQDPDAKIISYATTPTLPSYPNKPLILCLAAAMAFFVGVGYVMIREILYNGFRSAIDLERKAGYDCYGLIPQATGVTKKDLANYILQKPSSSVAESVRTLRMALTLRGEKDGKKPKVIAITSSLPGEGKTTLSTWMARLAAKSGEKVIVIDCDLRRPNLNRLLNITPDKTLADYLSGQSRLEDVIHRNDTSGAHMIFARAVPNTALDLLSSDKMKNLISSLSQVYDLVILDTAASLAASDARILANVSDHTLYVVSWNRTGQDVVMNGIKQFTDFNYKKLSFVLSNVDLRQHAQYGFGDVGYYYGRFKDYYAN